MSTLSEEINVYKETFKKKAPEEKQRMMAQATKELEASGAAQGLKEGEQIPDFTLTDATGTQVSIQTLLAEGPVILTFYRGGWCPYCNLELKAYQNNLSDIAAAGASLVAISPEIPDASLNTKEKNNLEFTVLSDVGNKVAGQFDLVFNMPDYLISIYKDSGLDVAGHNGNDEWSLPKPATFVIDSSGKILFAEVDADYTYRTPPEKVIEFVKNI